MTDGEYRLLQVSSSADALLQQRTTGITRTGCGFRIRVSTAQRSVPCDDERAWKFPIDDRFNEHHHGRMPTDTELFKWFDGLREEKRIEILMVFITRPVEERTLKSTMLAFWLKTEGSRFLFGDPDPRDAV
jgi:hypothetical protein